MTRQSPSSSNLTLQAIASLGIVGLALAGATYAFLAPPAPKQEAWVVLALDVSRTSAPKTMCED